VLPVPRALHRGLTRREEEEEEEEADFPCRPCAPVAAAPRAGAAALLWPAGSSGAGSPQRLAAPPRGETGVGFGIGDGGRGAGDSRQAGSRGPCLVALRAASCWAGRRPQAGPAERAQRGGTQPRAEG
ncbi:unnamed protein product, partial [Prorocentrum cordatum]